MIAVLALAPVAGGGDAPPAAEAPGRRGSRTRWLLKKPRRYEEAEPTEAPAEEAALAEEAARLKKLYRSHRSTARESR
ncbi:MAG: hypothetical protein R2854_19475 [Caldilineaceae bacterium]